ncbi:unnamed protein product [Pipistrellus nathusii]|uniref:Uncharacterized protein n=1 Tax=Pipistrellus nathusii TaxID=59473 RepID=A0ABP0ABW8_PIPNA
MPLWNVLGHGLGHEAHHCRVVRSYLKVTSIQYQRSLRIYFFKKVLNILDSLDCHFLHKAADTVYRVLTFFHIKYIFLNCSLYIGGFWSGELLRRAGDLQTVPGCAEPGPALWHLHARGKQVLWPTGQRETPIKERAIALSKGITSTELSTDHRILCSSVPWGWEGCPQATIARVKYSPSEHLIGSAFWESRWKRELEIKKCLTPRIQIVLSYYKANTLQ